MKESQLPSAREKPKLQEKSKQTRLPGFPNYKQVVYRFKIFHLLLHFCGVHFFSCKKVVFFLFSAFFMALICKHRKISLSGNIIHSSTLSMPRHLSFCPYLSVFFVFYCFLRRICFVTFMNCRSVSHELAGLIAVVFLLSSL